MLKVTYSSIGPGVILNYLSLLFVNCHPHVNMIKYLLTYDGLTAHALSYKKQWLFVRSVGGKIRPCKMVELQQCYIQRTRQKENKCRY